MDDDDAQNAPTQPIAAPGDAAEPVRAIVPAGKGQHWQALADYLNEDDAAEDAVRVTGEPVTLAAPDDATGDEETPKPGPVPLAPVGPFRDSVRRAYLGAVNLPTPGGLGPLLFALIVFGMAIIPVGPNGETRLQLLWGTVTGSVTIPGNDQGAYGIVTGFVQKVERQIQQTGGLTPGVGAGPAGMPGYVEADDLSAYGGGMYERLY